MDNSSRFMLATLIDGRVSVIGLDHVRSVIPTAAYGGRTGKTQLEIAFSDGESVLLGAAGGRALLSAIGVPDKSIDEMLPRAAADMPRPATDHTGEPVVTEPPLDQQRIARILGSTRFESLSDTQKIPCEGSARTNAGLVDSILRLPEMESRP